MKQENKFSSCVVCSEPIDNDSIVYCPHCKRPYHERCWKKAGYGCKIYKCKGSTLFRWPKIEILITTLIGQHETLLVECTNQNCINYLKETSPFYRYCTKCGEELNSLDKQKKVFAYPIFEFIARNIIIFIVLLLLPFFLFLFASIANSEVIKQNQSYETQIAVSFQLTAFKTQKQQPTEVTNTIPTNVVDTPIPQSPPTDIVDTPIPQPQPTDAITYCAGAPPQRVVVGDKGYVCTQSDNLIVHNGPGKSKRKVAEIATGTNFVIDKGPICSDNWSWWRIRTTSGILGWVAEGGDSVDSYFICPK